jgi:hypothetical protein
MFELGDSKFSVSFVRQQNKFAGGREAKSLEGKLLTDIDTFKKVESLFAPLFIPFSR